MSEVKLIKCLNCKESYEINAFENNKCPSCKTLISKNDKARGNREFPPLFFQWTLAILLFAYDYGNTDTNKIIVLISSFVVLFYLIFLSTSLFKVLNIEKYYYNKTLNIISSIIGVAGFFVIGGYAEDKIDGFFGTATATLEFIPHNILLLTLATVAYILPGLIFKSVKRTKKG